MWKGLVPMVRLLEVWSAWVMGGEVGSGGLVREGRGNRLVF